MALTELLAALSAELVAEQHEEILRYQQEADQLLTDARRRAEREHDRIVSDSRAAAEREAASLLAEARAGARRELSQARRECLLRVLDEVQQRLARLPGSVRGSQVATDSAREALQALPAAEVVRLHPGDTIHGCNLPAGDPLTVGGAIVVAADGSFVDNTVTTRLQNLWPTLAVQLGQSFQGTP